MIFASTVRFFVLVMYDLRNLSDTELVDILSEQTVKLTNLFALRLMTPEYHECKLLIKALTSEIKARKVLRKDQKAANPDSFFTEA
jgi:hypothetical protein